MTAENLNLEIDRLFGVITHSVEKDCGDFFKWSKVEQSIDRFIDYSFRIGHYNHKPLSWGVKEFIGQQNKHIKAFMVKHHKADG